MTKTITRLFDNRADAERAAHELESIGVDRDDISIVASGGDSAASTSAYDSDTGTTGAATTGGVFGSDTAATTGHEGHSHDVTDVNDHGDVSRGVSTGAAIGGVGGLLAGLGLLAIPGLGPVVAAGWLVAAVTGAGIGAAGGGATGSIVGALKNAGHSDEEANVYSEGVRRGGTLVSARIDDSLATQADAVLQRYNAVDATTRGADYRSTGWTGFDANATAYSDQNERDVTRHNSSV